MRKYILEIIFHDENIKDDPDNVIRNLKELIRSNAESVGLKNCSFMEKTKQE